MADLEGWEVVILAIAVAMLVVVVAGLVIWHLASTRSKRIAGRIQALSWQGRLRLAAGLLRDERIPAGVRFIPALLVLYLALPIDVLPDFIPVLGQIDDVVVVVVGLGLLLRFAPAQVMESHLWALENRGFGRA